MLLTVSLVNFSSQVVEVSTTDTVGHVVALILRKLGVMDECPIGSFGLFPCYDIVNHGSCLSEDTVALGALTGCSRVVFKIACFGPLLLSSVDPRVLFLRFIQACHDITTGLLPCPPSSLSSLASLALHQRFGAFDGDVFRKDGSVLDLLLELVPSEAFNMKHPSKWEAEILQKYKQLRECPHVDPIRKYLEIVEGFEFYGSTCFDEEYCSKLVVLAVSASGVAVFDDDGLERLFSYKWLEMNGWGMRSDNQIFIETRNGERVGFSGSPAVLATLTRMATIIASDNPAVCVGNTSMEEETESLMKAMVLPQSEMNSEQAAILLQSCARGILVRKRFREIERDMAATYLQAIVRGFLAFKRTQQHANNAEESDNSCCGGSITPPPGMDQAVHKMRTSTNGTFKPLSVKPPGVLPPKAPSSPLMPPPGLLGDALAGGGVKSPTLLAPSLPDSTEHIILPPPLSKNNIVEDVLLPPPPPPSVPPPDLPSKRVFTAPKPPPPIEQDDDDDDQVNTEDEYTDDEAILFPLGSPPSDSAAKKFYLPTSPLTPPTSPLTPPTSDVEEEEHV